jgi:hypothetical protein
MSGKLSRGRRGAVLCCLVGATLFATGCDENAGSAAPGAPAAGPSTDAGETGSEAAGAPPDAAAFEGTGFTQDPCSLITDAEMSQQLGSQVTAVPDSDLPTMCEWTPGGRPALNSTFLEYQKQNSRFHLDVIRDLQRTTTGPGVQRLDIGNGALLNTARHEISVLVGSSTFRIGGGVPAPLSNDALANLARLAQSRLH